VLNNPSLFIKTHFQKLLLTFCILVFYQFLDQTLTGVLEKLFRSHDGAPPWVWGIAVLSVLLNMLAPLVLAFCLLGLLKTTKSLKDFEQLVIESLRAWGSTFLWTLLLIVPGVVKWIAYFFVPFVVLFSKKYSLGEVDALQHSQKIFFNTWGKLLIVLFFFSVLFPLVSFSVFDGYRKVWETPLFSLMASVFDFTVLSLGLFLSFVLFKKSLKEVGDEFVF